MKYEEKWITLNRNRVYEEDGTGQTVMLGAFYSPAAMRDPARNACIWEGCAELGTHDHICWQCPHRPKELRPPKTPADPLEKRLGWSRDGKWQSLEWLKYVAKEVWIQRYGHKSQWLTRRNADMKGLYKDAADSDAEEWLEANEGDSEGSELDQDLEEAK